jgi:hypothetical protein
MGKIFVGGTEFNAPPKNPPIVDVVKPMSSIRKLTKKEIVILSVIVISLLIMGWLPTQLIYTAKVIKLEKRIVQLDPLNKIEVDLKHKLDKLEQNLKVEDDDLYKILSQLRNQRKLLILDQLDQIQLFKSKQNVYMFDYFNSKTQELKQKEILYHR